MKGILLVQEFIKRITGGSAEIGTHAEDWIRCGCLVVEERRKTAATHGAVLVRPQLGGCLRVILRERGPPSTVVGSSGRNML